MHPLINFLVHYFHYFLKSRCKFKCSWFQIWIWLCIKGPTVRKKNLNYMLLKRASPSLKKKLQSIDYHFPLIYCYQLNTFHFKEKMWLGIKPFHANVSIRFCTFMLRFHVFSRFKFGTMWYLRHLRGKILKERNLTEKLVWNGLYFEWYYFIDILNLRN